MAAYKEQTNLYVSWKIQENLDTDTTGINAGEVLKSAIDQEIVTDITRDDVNIDITEIIEDIKYIESKWKKIKEKYDEQVVVNEQNPVLKALLFLFDILSRIFNILFYLGIIILCSIGATYLANKFGIINIF